MSGSRTTPLAPDGVAAVERLAVAFEGRRRTHAALGDRAARVALALRGLGIEDGDHVAMLSSNCLEYLEVEAGIVAAGATAAHLDWRISPTGAADALRRCHARAVFAEAHLLSMLGTLRRLGETPHLRTIVALARGPGDLDYEELCATADGARGTDAKPVAAADERLALGMDCSTYVVADLGRASRHALAWPVLAAGGAVHVRRSGPFAAPSVLGYVARNRITHVVWAPSMVQAVLDGGEHERVDLSALRAIVCPDSPAAADRLRAALPGVDVIG